MDRVAGHDNFPADEVAVTPLDPACFAQPHVRVREEFHQVGRSFREPPAAGADGIDQGEELLAGREPVRQVFRADRHAAQFGGRVRPTGALLDREGEQRAQPFEGVVEPGRGQAVFFLRVQSWHCSAMMRRISRVGNSGQLRTRAAKICFP